ncbi:MAG TPA: hypothetical protein DD640_06590 [Clostridiales bacterium]|nr:hypothetical protein [Clostridiales bacterium]
MAKLKDIASQLKVSVSTVSRVVNNQNRVDPDTRKRILDALKKYDYQPDQNARSLKTNVAKVLGVIVPDISNPFYATVIKGIERVASLNGYTVILCNTDENKQRERDATQLLLRQKVAGLIVATTFSGPEAQQVYLPVERPVVFFDNVPATAREINSVTINNTRAARELTEFMIRRGHRRIFLIAGPAGESSSDERQQGWRLALEAAGIEPGADWFSHGDFREESGREIMEDFLRRPQADRPTAVCIANNFMAYGAVKAVLDQGLDIPGDLSVAAFDIIDTTGLLKLCITTVQQPAADIGALAAELCLQDNTRQGIRFSQRLVLEHQFCPNSSVSPIDPDSQP